MRFRQLSSMILLASILLQCTACGGSTDPIGGSDSADTTTEAAPVGEYTVPDVDYDGKTVSITGYSYTGNWSILRYNIALDEENGDVINDAIVKRNQAVEQALNVNIELIPLGSGDRGSAATLEKYIMAQEDVVTYAMQMNAGLSKLLTTEGMLIDMNEIPTLDLSHTWWNQNANDEYTIYGKQLAAVGDACFFNLGAPVVMYFSKQLIKDNKLADPYQLVYDGKWTIDTMKKMAEDAARDVNGNTTPDEEDIYGIATEMDTMSYAMFGAGIRYSDRDNAGDIQVKLNNEKTINTTEKMRALIRNSAVSLYAQDLEKGYSNVHSDYFMPKLMADELLFYTNQLLVTLNLRAMESDFGIVPMPKYDEKQEKYISIANTWFSDHIVVPATSGDLELVGHLLDAMGYYGQQYITPAFIDESIKTKGVRDEDSLKMIEMIHENQIFDVGLMFNWGGMTGILQTLTRPAENSFATLWAGIETKVETALADTVKTLKGE